MRNLLCLLSIICGEMEHYLKSNCCFLFIPDQTPDTTPFFVRLTVRIGNDTVVADGAALIGVVVRKKTSEGRGIGSGVSGYIKGNDTGHNPASGSHIFVPCAQGIGMPPAPAPNCFDYKTDKYILEFLYMRFRCVDVLSGTFGG